MKLDGTMVDLLINLAPDLYKSRIMIVVCLPSPSPNPTNITIMSTDVNQSPKPNSIPLPGLTAAVVNLLTCVRKELENFISSLPDFLQPIATHELFKTLKLYTDLDCKEHASVCLKKDIFPHSLCFKFEITPSKVTKDLPEFKALLERASAALSGFQTAAKTIIVDAIALEFHHIQNLQTKSIVDGITQLASAFMAFYAISSTNATADPIVKYHLFNSLFCSTEAPGKPSDPVRRTDVMFHQSGHFDSEESYDSTKTEELKTLYKSFEGICVKLFTYPADHFCRSQLVYGASQAFEKLSNEAITGEKAKTISEV